MLLTVRFEKILIPKLKRKAAQPIYTEGPAWHISKSGTPTLGGLAFLLASIICIIFGAAFSFIFIENRVAISLIITILFAVLNSLIGILDDWRKLSKKDNLGLTPKEKLFLQLIVAIAFLLARAYFLKESTIIAFSFGEYDLGFLYYPLSLFILLGIINCANLTDGIDGLSSSVAFSIGVSIFYISASLNTENSIIASVIIGTSIGFLFFNIHPAKIFMGDTGSLFFGAIISASAFNLQNPILILSIAGVYVIEGISVALQVVVYKLTKRRLFKMAPLHHHFEKCGWPENRICIAAILLTFIMSIPAYILYLP
jgi:phospho-N-acetylmuramoyl-pentapeptide-transferase